MPINEVAVKAVRDYLVDLLRQEDWCRARSVGQALEILVGGGRPQVEEIRTGTPTEAMRMQHLEGADSIRL